MSIQHFRLNSASFRTRNATAAWAGVLAIAAFSTVGAQPQDASANEVTPHSWTQLRNGVDNTGYVAATLDAEWSYRAPRPVRGLSVAAGLVLLGTESANADALNPDKAGLDQQGMLIALNASTGARIWMRTVPSWIHGDPAIYNGRALVSFGQWPMTGVGGVMAVNLKNGRSLWSFYTETGIMPAPAIDSSGNALLVVGDGVLYTLALGTGAVIRAVGLRSPDGMSSPRIDERRRVYLGTNNALLSMSTYGRRNEWEYRSSLSGLLDVPVALGDSVAFIAGWKFCSVACAAREVSFASLLGLLNDARKSKTLFAFKGWLGEQTLLAVSRSSGRLLWQRDLGVGPTVTRNTSGTPVVAGSEVIVSSPFSKMIWAFDIATGHVIWRRSVGAIHKGAVTIVSGDLVFGDASGNLTLLRRDTGELVGTCSTGSAFTPLAPVVVGRTLLVATHDGWVHAVPYDSLRNRIASNPHSRCY